MAKKSQKAALGIEWDLSDLYSGLNEPKIKKDKDKLLLKVKSFNNKYKGKINSKNLTPEFLFEALKKYEEILESAHIYSYFAQLLHAKNTTDPKIGHFYQEAQEFATHVETELLWFELEWIKVEDKKANQVVKSSKLKDYKHFLTTARLFKPYLKSEEEEKILAQKDQTSSKAFIRLYDQHSSQLKFPLKVDGKIKRLSLSEIAPYLTSHKDRNVRKRAIFALSKGLKENADLYTFILNTLLLDKKILDEIKGYKYPEQETFLEYEVDPDVVKVMSEAIVKRHDIVERFYLAKKRLLGYRKLYEWDRYSSIYPEVTEEYRWRQAKDLVLDSFNGFSKDFANVAKRFFENDWIDAEIADGKMHGGFCSNLTPSTHPYILLNYSGEMNDVTTLAHELGHGVHIQFSRHNLLQFHPTTLVAEIASTFGEMLVFEKLYESTSDKRVKINLLADRIQKSFATIFRQNAFFLFEKDIHKKRRTEGELTTEELSNLYQEHLRVMFGKGLELTGKHKYMWMPILHFYYFNFYVFTYSFGELLTTALYARYKEQGKKFVDDYLSALAAGGSKSPKEIVAMMGLDFSEKGFWDKGLELIEDYVEEFEKIVGE